MRYAVVVVAVAILSASTRMDAQLNARPAFEVASVKPSNDSNEGPRGISFSPGGRFAWNRMTLEQLVATAYSESGFKDVVGGPDWISTARFDIAAISEDALREVAPDGTPRGLFLRLQSLLEDRFQLRTHSEDRVLAVFDLMPAATPPAIGPGLRRVDIDCDAVTRALAGRGSTAAPAGPAPPPGQAPPVPQCALRASLAHVTGRAITLSQLADALSAPSRRPVLDRSGLSGYFDVDLVWAPDLPPGALINGQTAPPNDGPSLFTAIREQLGLRLDATRAAVPVLVIDSAAHPTPN